MVGFAIAKGAPLDDVREHAVARLYCPACGDWLVPIVAFTPDVAAPARGDLTCIGCSASYAWRDGVPSIESYLNDPCSTRPEDLLTEIRMPVKKA